MTEIPPELLAEAIKVVAAATGIRPEEVVVGGIPFQIALAGIRRGKELAPVNLGGGGI